VLDDTVPAQSGGMVAVHAVYPTAGPTQGPYPVVVVGHGFQLPPSQYYKYLESLAGYGYVALTVDFQAGFFAINNVNNAKDLLAGLDWAAAEPALAGKADATLAGATGHSLGGKLALLAATLDPRIKASITLDPVDGAMGCNPTDCPDVSNLMPTLSIPTGFLGETLDASGGFTPCAPAANNFLTFYQGANSPSFAVTVNGANHMSFLDDVASCGFNCTFCNMPTADNATVNALSRAYVVAFYERHLRGIAAYDAWLTGAEATAKWGNLVSIQAK
jgi:predicted dienelactone hydrolase